MPHRNDVFAPLPQTQRDEATLVDSPLDAPVAARVPARVRGENGLRFCLAPGARPLPGLELIRGVGRGGFGEVYLARRDDGSQVALKLLTQDGDVELRGVGECLELRHPNLVEVRAVHRDASGFPWVEMEYLPGPNLRQLLQRHPHGLPIAEVGRIFAALAAGVGCLHAAGVVHRDLKPANIFVGATVKVGDYGLAKAMAQSRRSGHTESVGTCHYMAPEIGQGRYGREVDIYALGALLHEMLTGRVPFEGETSQEVLMKHLTCEPDLADFSPALQAILARALAKHPEDRFASVAEMAEAVAAALAGGECWNTGRGLPTLRLISLRASCEALTQHHTPSRPTASSVPRPAPTVASESGAPAASAASDFWLTPRLAAVGAVLLAWCYWHGWFWTLALGGVSLYALGTTIRAVLARASSSAVDATAANIPGGPVF